MENSSSPVDQNNIQKAFALKIFLAKKKTFQEKNGMICDIRECDLFVTLRGPEVGGPYTDKPAYPGLTHSARNCHERYIFLESSHPSLILPYIKITFLYFSFRLSLSKRETENTAEQLATKPKRTLVDVGSQFSFTRSCMWQSRFLANFSRCVTQFTPYSKSKI